LILVADKCVTVWLVTIASKYKRGAQLSRSDDANERRRVVLYV